MIAPLIKISSIVVANIAIPLIVIPNIVIPPDYYYQYCSFLHLQLNNLSLIHIRIKIISH